MRHAVASGAVLACLVLTAGCLSRRENLVRVSDVDGSGDHRIFRIGDVTKLMLEPALWQLEDCERINFDRPVSLYCKDRLPPEFDQVTLRMLHDNLSGLPRDLCDPWCLGDLSDGLWRALLGTEVGARYDVRANFVRGLWDPRVRGAVRRGEPGYSNAGYALMMMAISDELGETPEQLLQRYVVRPYGLQDTSFALRPDMAARVTKSCAGTYPWLYPAGREVPDHRGGEVTASTGGLLSSASDILKVCYVIRPHLDRARGLFDERRLEDGRKVLYRLGTTCGGSAFVGFDVKSDHAVVVLENATKRGEDEGFEILDSLGPKARR